jgi:hypothetical protein
MTPLIALLLRTVALILFVIAFLFGLASLNGRSEAGWLAFFGIASGSVGLAIRWLVKRGARKAAEAARIQRQLAVLKLAEAEDGRLTVTEVAARLGWTLRTAQGVLRALEDGVRVTTTTTDDGIMLYDFPELIYDPGRSKGARAR